MLSPGVIFKYSLAYANYLYLFIYIYIYISEKTRPVVKTDVSLRRNCTYKQVSSSFFSFKCISLPHFIMERCNEK